jgi:hypothetical protein
VISIICHILGHDVPFASILCYSLACPLEIKSIFIPSKFSIRIRMKLHDANLYASPEKKSMLCHSDVKLTFFLKIKLTILPPDLSLQAEGASYSEGACGICCEAEGPRHRHHPAVVHSVISSYPLSLPYKCLPHWST